jgi:copper chaperone CopZ
MIVTNEIMVLGMHCSSCSATIEESLAPLAGVHSVKANYLKSRVIIRFDDEIISLAAMAEVCKEMGFTFQLTDENRQSKILNSTLIHLKNLSVFTLIPKGNSQIFLLTPFREGVNQEKNRTPILICQSRIIS